MSKSAMLRTRRRDVNVKPNRRLDRKSSRGMIYENEELRLRTININAEIERGQSDIKKLRRENEQLRKEIWCLRDEYEKLDKLLKEKGDTSCSSCSSDTDSCTSCTESEENETTQNIENVQKTTLNNLRTEFDHLSVVTEETSAENSDKNSNSATSPKECAWDVIPPDQSYPNSQTLPLPTSKSALQMEQMPKHFFAPLKPSKSYESCHENNLCASSWSLGENTYGNTPTNWMQFVNFDQNVNNDSPNVMQKPCHQVIAQKAVLPPPPVPDFESNLPPPPMFDPNLSPLPLPPKYQSRLPTNDLPLCKKTTPDILVKTDLPNFSQESSTNSFVNGGNLDELLQDIQTISNDILQISAQQDANQKLTNTFVPNVTIEQFEPNEEFDEELLDESKYNSNERPYKSELNVVLMPKAMPLLGFDKYQNIKSSIESLATLKKSVESLPTLDIPAPDMNFPNVPTSVPAQSFTPQPFPTELLSFTPTPKPDTPIPPISPPTKLHPELNRQASNPFFYGTFDNYQNTDSFANRYNPDIFAHDNYGFKNEVLQQSSNKPEEKDDKTNIKTNIENEIVENKVGNKPEKEAKQEKSENEKNDSKKELNKKEDAQQKSPKSRRTRKVSIYFKGKKDKLARSLSLDTKMIHQETPKLADKSPIIDERKSSLANPKTSSSESKMSLFDGIPLKNQDTAEKIINSDTNKTSSDSKNSNYDRKHRKSSSTSPERKHVHVKLENEKKCHKKRHKKSERRLPANRRASMSADRVRERSFSVCTDRSNILDSKFGHFEDYTNSERDRSNSLSSCDTVKSRKMSTVPQCQVTGKIPWFGCWGNGCL